MVPRASHALLARLDDDLEGVEPALAAARRAILDAEATLIAAVQTQCAAISKELGSVAAARTAALTQTRNAVLASLGSLEATASGLGDIVAEASDVDIIAHAPALAARVRSLLDSSAELVALEEPRVQQAQQSRWSLPGVADLGARVAVVKTAIENLGRGVPNLTPQLWPPAAVVPVARQPCGTAAAAAGLRPASSLLDLSRASSNERGVSPASPHARLSHNSSSDLSMARGGAGERRGVVDHGGGGARSPPPRVAFSAPDVSSSSFDDCVVIRLLVRSGARGPGVAEEERALTPAAAAVAGDSRSARGLVGGPRTGAQRHCPTAPGCGRADRLLRRVLRRARGHRCRPGACDVLLYAESGAVQCCPTRRSPPNACASHCCQRAGLRRGAATRGSRWSTPRRWHRPW